MTRASGCRAAGWSTAVHVRLALDRVGLDGGSTPWTRPICPDRPWSWSMRLHLGAVCGQGDVRRHLDGRGDVGDLRAMKMLLDAAFPARRRRPRRRSRWASSDDPVVGAMAAVALDRDQQRHPRPRPQPGHGTRHRRRRPEAASIAGPAGTLSIDPPHERAPGPPDLQSAGGLVLLGSPSPSTGPAGSTMVRPASSTRRPRSPSSNCGPARLFDLASGRSAAVCCSDGR